MLFVFSLLTNPQSILNFLQAERQRRLVQISIMYGTDIVGGRACSCPVLLYVLCPCTRILFDNFNHGTLSQTFRKYKRHHINRLLLIDSATRSLKKPPTDLPNMIAISTHPKHVLYFKCTVARWLIIYSGISLTNDVRSVIPNFIFPHYLHLLDF